MRSSVRRVREGRHDLTGSRWDDAPFTSATRIRHTASTPASANQATDSAKVGALSVVNTTFTSQSMSASRADVTAPSRFLRMAVDRAPGRICSSTSGRWENRAPVSSSRRSRS